MNSVELNMKVVKDNALINASYNLDLVEQRLVLLAIVEARESGKGINANDPLAVHADSYVNQFSVSRQAAYLALKEASKDLFARQFSYQEINKRGKIENVLSRWVSEIRYVDDEAIVKLIFAPAIIPLITRLEQHFTSYELKQVSQLSSKYAMRLYELLISWRSAGKTPFFELEDFRSKLGLDSKEYSTMCNFKKYVLDLAIKQINEHTDITATYEQHKKGRTITGFSFKFKQKPQPKKELTRDPNTLDMFCNLSDKQISYYSNIMSKLHSISDLAGNKDYPAFAVWIANILRDPAGVREETAKRIFKALRTETDFKD
jgi:plasmid replication initiation protein